MSTSGPTTRPIRHHGSSSLRPAVVFSLDDVHPARSEHGYEAGGDMDRGVLGRLVRLLERHESLKATLFVTADWRERSADPTRRFLAACPWLRDRVFLADRWPSGFMALDRHRDFVQYINGLDRVEVAPHGLTHVGRGREIPQEFLRLSAGRCERAVAEMEAVFDRSGIRWARGIAPPGWAAPAGLVRTLNARGYRFIQCARDLVTPIRPGARCNGVGLKGLALLQPEVMPGTGIVHIPANWSATSDEDRAIRILDAGGVLSVKAHAVMKMRDRVSVDGLDDRYVAQLDRLFSRIERDFGSTVQWCHVSELAEVFRA